MEFLKKHYEKLILSVVLLGLAAVAATLPMKVNEEKQKEEDRKNSLIGAKVEPLKPVDLTTNQAVLAKDKGMTAGGVGTLKDVQGPPEAPTALVLTLPDRTDITISKEKPFTRIIGYAADLYNGITQPPYARKAAKVGETIAFGTDAYL